MSELKLILFKKNQWIIDEYKKHSIIGHEYNWTFKYFFVYNDKIKLFFKINNLNLYHFINVKFKLQFYLTPTTLLRFSVVFHQFTIDSPTVILDDILYNQKIYKIELIAEKLIPDFCFENIKYFKQYKPIETNIDWKFNNKKKLWVNLGERVYRLELIPYGLTNYINCSVNGYSIIIPEYIINQTLVLKYCRICDFDLSIGTFILILNYQIDGELSHFNNLSIDELLDVFFWAELYWYDDIIKLYVIIQFVKNLSKISPFALLSLLLNYNVFDYYIIKKIVKYINYHDRQDDKNEFMQVNCEYLVNCDDKKDDQYYCRFFVNPLNKWLKINKKSLCYNSRI